MFAIFTAKIIRHEKHFTDHHCLAPNNLQKG